MKADVRKVGNVGNNHITKTDDKRKKKPQSLSNPFLTLHSETNPQSF